MTRKPANFRIEITMQLYIKCMYQAEDITKATTRINYNEFKVVFINILIKEKLSLKINQSCSEMIPVCSL